MAAKQYRPWSPHQSYLLPPSPLEWLPEGHLAYFVLEVVQSLDLSDIENALHKKDPRGERPYSPQMMVALLIYGYCVGVFSSRKIAQATHDYVAFRVLAGGCHPHFTTINLFRLSHQEALAGRFLEVLKLCQKAGLVKLGHVSLDGSKVQANASKHKAMSYERMEKQEAHLREEIEAMFAKADAIDREEDQRYGHGQELEDLPEELRRRETRLARIRAAKAELEREAAWARAAELLELAQAQKEKSTDESVEPAEQKRAAARAGKHEEKARELSKSGDDDDDDAPPQSESEPGGLPHHRVSTTPEGKPAPKAQRNFTDADSRIMKNNKGFLQGYNAQIAVDSESQVIVAECVTNQSPDQEHLGPMVERIVANCGETPKVLSADSGYFSMENVDACEQRGIDPYIAVSRKNGARSAEEEAEKPASPAQQARQTMRQKLATQTGKQLYARRKVIAEPPFGQIKEARGFRRFSFRGTKKVRAEWTLICLTHNLLKLFRATWSGKSARYPTAALAPA